MKRRRVIHVHLVHDDTAVWIESKHPRRGKGAGGGQFTSGAGGGGAGGGAPKVGERAGKGGIVRPGGWWGREANVGKGEAKGETSGWTAERLATGLAEPNHPSYQMPPHHPGGSVWGESGRPPFDPEELAKLEPSTTQPEHLDSWEKMSEAAKEGRQQFLDIMTRVAKRLGHKLEPVRSPDDLTPEDVASKQGLAFVAPLKREARSREKVATDYKGQWKHLKDIIRGTIAVNHISEIRDAIKAVEAEGLKLAMHPKDKFSNPTPEGYRDLNTVVRLPNGMVAELQYNLKPLAHGKGAAHGDYEQIQKLQRFHATMEPTPQWPLKHVQKLMKHRKANRAIYDPLWEKATS